MSTSLILLSVLVSALALSDAERNHSTEMNAAKNVASSTVVKGGVKVLFLGNSITLHAPAPQIGWTNSWGMAASSAENDYVHIVTRGIEAKLGRKADVRVRNVAGFERNFETWKPSPEIEELTKFDPDYLIIAIGENTRDLRTHEDRLAYTDALKKLISLFLRGRTKPHTVVRGVFWKNPWKDWCLERAASDLALTFVKTDFNKCREMCAYGKFWHEGVAGHPGDAGMQATATAILEGFFPVDSGYAAWVDGRPVDVEPIRVSRQPFNQWAASYQRPQDQTEIAGMLRFETDGPSRLVVRQFGQTRPTTNVIVRPLSARVKPAVAKDGVISFTLPKPGYYVLEIDGYHRPLEIFAQQRRDFAAEKKEANIVFGPGIHNPVIVKLKSHDRVYIDKDAIVYGSFQADKVEDVKVSGYGIISGARNRRVGHACYREGMDGAVRIIDSHRITFDGPTVLDSCCWCVAAFNSSDLELRNLKVTGAWRYNTDGIDICNSQRVRVSNCFVHSFDDTLVVKGISHDYVEMKKALSLDFKRNEPIEDIVFSNCVCWCGWGRTLELGLETWASRIAGVVFEDCDLIHNAIYALSVHLGGPAMVDDVTYRNIRIESDGCEERCVYQTNRDQKADCKPGNALCWLTISNYKMFSKGFYEGNKTLLNEPRGNFKKVTVDNVSITRTNGAPKPYREINMEKVKAGEISITNIKMDGVDE